MYESYYGLSAKPFQLRPDPAFFFGSKGHKRALAYLEYGLSQGEGFIVITGEVGAGKTTLMRSLLRKLASENIVAAQIVTTHVDSDDMLKMVATAFGLNANGTKSDLLTRIEQFMHYNDQQGKRCLLIVDEAQNLSAPVVEELRMLSNFQTSDRSLLQTFLLGQPEFRKTLLGPGMEQLRQRVIATYHLGPLDSAETSAYIQHRLHTVGWNNDPSFTEEAFHAIHAYTGGIPRKINSFCDRLMLMGYLEEIHAFDVLEIRQVISDIEAEFNLPADAIKPVSSPPMTPSQSAEPPIPFDSMAVIDERLARMERSVGSVIDAVKKLITTPKYRNFQEDGN